MRGFLLTVITPAVLVFGHPSTIGAQEGIPFKGLALPKILQPAGRVSCFSDQAATTGYYRNLSPDAGKPEVVLTHTPLKSQTAGGGYKIAIENDQATVDDEVTKHSDQFHVYKRDQNGVILVRFKGIGLVVITVDPQNGSFVLTDATVQRLGNRASVWVGRCFQGLGD